jgi:hypothetical protein
MAAYTSRLRPHTLVHQALSADVTAAAAGSLRPHALVALRPHTLVHQASSAGVTAARRVIALN